jgi:hypothetical protein
MNAYVQSIQKKYLSFSRTRTCDVPFYYRSRPLLCFASIDNIIIMNLSFAALAAAFIGLSGFEVGPAAVSALDAWEVVTGDTIDVTSVGPFTAEVKVELSVDLPNSGELWVRFYVAEQIDQTQALLSDNPGVVTGADVASRGYYQCDQGGSEIASGYVKFSYAGGLDVPATQGGTLVPNAGAGDSGQFLFTISQPDEAGIWYPGAVSHNNETKNGILLWLTTNNYFLNGFF